MKWLTFLLTASTTAATATTAGTLPPGAQVTNAPTGIVSVLEHEPEDLMETVFAMQVEKTLLEEQAEQARQLEANRTKLDGMISKLHKTVGKTWYVFSGTTPQGWDCSGLVLWAYEQVGITLEHRASIQGKAGKVTDAPTPGDIVVFTYKGYKSAYHTAIYIGDGLMIHAPRKGEVTRIESVEQFAGNYSKITYRNLLDN
jgi:cell wall-associated NlpC family hydrolase